MYENVKHSEKEIRETTHYSSLKIYYTYPEMILTKQEKEV